MRPPRNPRTSDRRRHDWWARADTREIEGRRRIELASEEPLERAAEAERVAERRLAQLAIAAVVIEQAIPFSDGAHRRLSVGAVPDGVADPKGRAPNRRVSVVDVPAGFACGLEPQRHRTGPHRANLSETELRFGHADPALANLRLGRRGHPRVIRSRRRARRPLGASRRDR